MNYRKFVLTIGIASLVLAILVIYFDTDWTSEVFIRISFFGGILFLGGLIIMVISFWIPSPLPAAAGEEDEDFDIDF